MLDASDRPGPVRSQPSLRDQRAAQTRTAIAEAGRRLFRARGYGATTLQAIAAEAGVAVQTVYAVHGSKAGILRALRESVVHQPAAEELFAQALGAADRDEALTLFARSIRTRWETGADVVQIHAEAAACDSQLRDEVKAVLTRRHRGIARLAEGLAGETAPGPDSARLVALMDALTMPEVYLQLTDAHGWSPAEYEAWLAPALRAAALVNPESHADGHRSGEQSPIGKFVGSVLRQR